MTIYAMRLAPLIWIHGLPMQRETYDRAFMGMYLRVFDVHAKGKAEGDGVQHCCKLASISL